MKKVDECFVLENKKLNQKDVYEIVLEGKEILTKPGQFVQIKIPGKFLPRPFSVAYQEDNKMHIVYRVVGKGTEILSNQKKKSILEVLGGLGNGFHLNMEGEKPLLIGGGTGVAPLYYLACSLIDKGIEPTFLFGFKELEDSIYLDKFEKLGQTFIAYEYNSKYSYVTDYLKEWQGNCFYNYFYGCGAFPMLKAAEEMIETDGEVSLESRMGCGIGQCKGCSIETTEGMKTICKDGPVFQKRLVKW